MVAPIDEFEEQNLQLLGHVCITSKHKSLNSIITPYFDRLIIAYWFTYFKKVIDTSQIKCYNYQHKVA